MKAKHRILRLISLFLALVIKAFSFPVGLIKRSFYYGCLLSNVPRANPTIQLEGFLDIVGTGRIDWGDSCRIGRDVQLETTNDGEIVMGENVRINRGCTVVSYARIEIGSDTLIGEFSSLRDANHGTGRDATIRTQDHVCKPICIGEDVWIGRGVCILAGVTIGKGSVIGANSVVTKNIPDYSIAAGAPARIIKKRE